MACGSERHIVHKTWQKLYCYSEAYESTSMQPSLEVRTALNTKMCSMSCNILFRLPVACGTALELFCQSRNIGHSCKRRASNTSNLDSVQSCSTHRSALAPCEKAISLDRSNGTLPRGRQRTGYRPRYGESNGTKHRHRQKRHSRKSQARYLNSSEDRMGFGIIAHSL
jgi:hypothetical protein